MEYVNDRGQVDFREYYRIGRDPQQLVNVLHDGDPTNDPNLAALSAVLARLQRVPARAVSPDETDAVSSAR